MISVHEAPNKEAIVHFLASLEDETTILEDIAEAASAARAISPGSEGLQELHRMLEQQAELCSRLESKRRERASVLAKEGHQAKDLLVVILGFLSKEDHPAAIKTFRRYIDMAEKTQREIDINREYFSVALSTLEDTIDAVVSTATSKEFYDSKGGSSGDNIALCVSTIT